MSDDINFDTFELKKYALAADGFVWKLWYHYDPSSQAWIDLGDASDMSCPNDTGMLREANQNELCRARLSSMIAMEVEWRSREGISKTYNSDNNIKKIPKGLTPD